MLGPDGTDSPWFCMGQKLNKGLSTKPYSSLFSTGLYVGFLGQEAFTGVTVQI